MKITEKQRNMLNKYKLYGFHSGGGCMHFAYETNNEDLLWLINDVDEYGEPSLRYPKNENDICLFGLDLNYLDDQNLINSILEIGKKHKIENDNGRCWIYFQDTLKDGVLKMKAITEEINNLWLDVTKLKIGDRVQFANDTWAICDAPTFETDVSNQKGTVVTFDDDTFVWIRLDIPNEEFEYWDNQIQFNLTNEQESGTSIDYLKKAKLIQEKV